MDYEKKYKEALERANKLQKTCDNSTIVGWMEYIFPELVESEDERIRKAIISIVAFSPEAVFDKVSVLREDCLAWLEKQGNQKPILEFKASNWYVSKVDGKIHDLTYNPTDNVKPKFNVGDKLISTKNPHLTYEIIDIEDNELGELDYKVIIYTDGKDGVTHNISCKNVDVWGELVKEKPAWSEDDEKIYQSIMDDTVQENQLNDKQINWLRDIKYRYFPQSKQKWSEEDETYLKQAIEEVEYALNDKNLIYTGNEDLIVWLKSLKERMGGK